jgi:hypothetical protein
MNYFYWKVTPLGRDNVKRNTLNPEAPPFTCLRLPAVGRGGELHFHEQ